MILPIEKQVPTRETCAALRDAGFTGNTAHYHVNFVESEKWYVLPEMQMVRRMALVNDYYPAPTAAELGVLLPDVLLIDGRTHHFSSTDLIGEFGVQYSHVTIDEEYQDEHLCCADTEAEARALLWLDLDAKGLLPAAAYGGE